MPEDGLSVSEIAERISVSDDAETIARLVRQIRYWTLVQALHPLEGVYTGTGVHRRYAEAEIYFAAVLSRAAAMGIAVGGLIGISTALRSHIRGRFGRGKALWQSAIAGKLAVVAIVGLRITDDASSYELAFAGLYDASQRKVMADIEHDLNSSEYQSAYLLRLTEIFSKLKPRA